VGETDINVRGRRMYLYRAIDSSGSTFEFWFSGAAQSDNRQTLPSLV
jgi:transposase-like protein